MKKFVFLLSIITVLVLACGCNKTTVSHGWTVITQVNGNGDEMEYYAVLNIKENVGGAVLKEKDIYINADGFSDSVAMKFVFSNSKQIASRKEISTTITESTIKEGDGWHHVGELTESLSYSYVEISTTSSMNFNEIVFLNESGEKLKLEFVRYGERSSSTKKVFKEYDKTELEKQISEGKMNNFTALNIIDEQDKF